MKEQETPVYQILQKEYAAAKTKPWQQSVMSTDLLDGLKDLSWGLNGTPKRFVAVLAGVIEAMKVEHVDVIIKARSYGGYLISLIPSAKESELNSLPGEEKYAQKNFIEMLIEEDHSLISAFTDTTIAGLDGGSIIPELIGLTAELQTNRQLMRETTDAVMRVVLNSIHGVATVKEGDVPDAFAQFISGLDIDLS